MALLAQEKLFAALVLFVVAIVPASAQERPAEVRRPVEERNRVKPEPVTLSGTFVAIRIDRDTLPVADRVVDDDGTTYLIEFDRMVIALQPDLRFRANVRYRRTLYAGDTRGRSRPTPVQTMNVTGRFELGDDGIHFIPDPSSDTRGLRMMSGTMVSGRELSIPFHYRNGTQQRQRTLVMHRRDNIL